MTRFNTAFTSEEAAAFKARNAAQAPGVVIIKATRPARKSERQEAIEMLDETRDMIAAAKRQGYWHLMPVLLQRVATLQASIAA
ncbi:MAG: hypothetical protein ACO3GP_07250 [Candidatus Limnocylindrus sp.]